MKAYNFERYRNGVLMAEGVCVHACDLLTAGMKAQRLLDKKSDRLLFVSNEPCTPMSRCPICAVPNPK